MVKRKVKHGAVVVLGRRYRVPDFKDLQEIEGQEIWVDDDDVCRCDSPNHGVYTDKHPRSYWPTKYRYYAYLELAE